MPEVVRHLSRPSVKPDSPCLQAWVYFYPTEDQQKTCDICGEQGLNGDLVIAYDVNRNPSLGDIRVQKERISWKTVNCLLAMLKLTIVKVLYLYVFNTLLSQEIRSLLCSSLCAIESCQHTKKCCLRYRPKWLNARQENAPGIVICVRAFEKEFQRGTEEIILVHLVYNIW